MGTFYIEIPIQQLWLNICKYFRSFQTTFSLEMCPDLTQTFFWPAVNKRPTCLWPRYFLIRPKDNFWRKKKKNEKFEFLGEIFKTQTQTKDGWPDLSSKKIDPTRVKKFWPRPIATFCLSLPNVAPRLLCENIFLIASQNHKYMN